LNTPDTSTRFGQTFDVRGTTAFARRAVVPKVTGQEEIGYYFAGRNRLIQLPVRGLDFNGDPPLPTAKELNMDHTVWGYTIYLVISIALTIWVARTLHANGRLFLVQTFSDNEELADSVNHLLKVGFYLINVGYVTLALRYGDNPENFREILEICSTKIGIVLVVLGGMHFLNLYIFSRMRKRARLLNEPPHGRAARRHPVGSDA
jgi:hypothetical protein